MLILGLFPGLELLDRAFREIPGWCVVAGPDRLLGGDVRDFHPPPGRFDGVIGGSPCQAFSALANLVRAKGLEPRFGNLVPEFERVVEEAQPLWFLHENVLRAPIPKPEGYRVKDFTICNSSIEGEDGLGQEQERVRRFTFGWNVRMVALRLCRTRDPGSTINLDPPCLLRWIPRAALRLPADQRAGAVSRDDTRGKRDREKGWGEPRPGRARIRTGAVSQTHVDNSPEAKGRVPAVVADARAVPVALRGSGKVKRTRQPAVASEDGPGTLDRMRHRAITGGGQNAGFPSTGTGGPRRSIPEMLRLQGLPEDLLDEQPFTAKAARKMVANGVPMPLGRAVARAVRMALEDMVETWDSRLAE